MQNVQARTTCSRSRSLRRQWRSRRRTANGPASEYRSGHTRSIGTSIHKIKELTSSWCHACPDLPGPLTKKMLCASAGEHASMTRQCQQWRQQLTFMALTFGEMILVSTLVMPGLEIVSRRNCTDVRNQRAESSEPSARTHRRQLVRVVEGQVAAQRSTVSSIGAQDCAPSDDFLIGNGRIHRLQAIHLATLAAAN